jgi:hypothetical protein
MLLLARAYPALTPADPAGWQLTAFYEAVPLSRIWNQLVLKSSLMYPKADVTKLVFSSSLRQNKLECFLIFESKDVAYPSGAHYRAPPYV